MSDQQTSPTMTDVGAAVAGFALSFAAALRSSEGGPSNDALEALAAELKELSGGMFDPNGKNTPARDALLITAAMLEASGRQNEGFTRHKTEEKASSPAPDQ